MVPNRLRQWFDQTGSRLLGSAADLCIVCGVRPIPAKAAAALPLCDRCRAVVPWIRPADIRCQDCGRPDPCPDCSRRVHSQVVCNRSAVRYDEIMKAWLSRLKYRGDERMHQLFADMMDGLLQRTLTELRLRRRDVALLTYVPLSAERLRERGFNQTERIARRLGEKSRIPVVSTLVRARHTDKMSYKSRAERLSDLQGAFEADRSFAVQPKSANSVIVLIDDVYTTGSTLHECAGTIRSTVPNIQIIGLTWAR